MKTISSLALILTSIIFVSCFSRGGALVDQTSEYSSLPINIVVNGDSFYVSLGGNTTQNGDGVVNNQHYYSTARNFAMYSSRLQSHVDTKRVFFKAFRNQGTNSAREEFLREQDGEVSFYIYQDWDMSASNYKDPYKHNVINQSYVNSFEIIPKDGFSYFPYDGTMYIKRLPNINSYNPKYSFRFVGEALKMPENQRPSGTINYSNFVSVSISGSGLIENVN